MLATPRFSHLIRLLSANPAQGLPLAEWCEPVDVDRLTAERDAALVALGPPSNDGDDGDDGDDEAALTFAAFAKASAAGKPTAEVRTNFAKFMAAAEALVGGSNGAALLAGVGACLTAPELSAFKREVEQGFGRLDLKQWNEAVVLARALSSWQRGPLNGSAGAAAAEPVTPKRHALAPEWGHGLVVHPIHSAPLPHGSHRDRPARDAAAVATTAATAGAKAAAAASSGSTSDAFAGSGDEDAAWLFQLCARHATMLPPREIAAGILAALALLPGNEPAAQAALFEVLGMDAFDSMAAVLQRASALKKLDLSRVMQYEPAATRPQQQSARHGAPSQDKPHVPAAQFSIRSQAELNAEKKARKDRQRAQRQGGGGASAEDDAAKDWLLDLGFDDAYLDQEPPKGDGVQRYQSSSEILGDGPREWGGGGDGARALPAGTTRAWREGYEEVRVPPPRALPPPAPGEVVDVTTALPEWAQLAFEGTRFLNRIQSAIFPVAFHSAENMLVCAPTGAGKTNCAMLALLQLVGQHVDPTTGALDKATLKAVYVAPMKALAQEVVTKFGERLAPLGLQVRELTGDTQLSRAEVEATHLIVTTPEKWDVITRKGGSDGSLATRCKLVIIDEVHLLADERGAVIESVVARTMRLVESAQTTVRVVALSATLPNYKDVALFLRVNLSRGLFFFGPEYRPVPLDQTYLGVAEKSRMKLAAKQNERAFEVCLDAVRRGHQVMVFVHARKDTVRTAQVIRDLATKAACSNDFSCGLPGAPQQDAFERFGKQVDKSKNAELRELFASGFLMHHAGMLRPDRTLVERAFAAGAAKVLVCTATLAWGVNLPAHSVVIKGTQVYDPSKGGHVDLSMLDVMQIFGRAGRPQYDTSGEATMITSADALPRYLALLGHQAPIESNFLKALPDHLNAEVASGTVTSVDEAVAWLSYTYLFVRMLKNPLAYGLTFESRGDDPELKVARFDKVCAAAKLLDERRMLRFDPRSGNLAATDLGRTASHFYIQHDTIGTFNLLLKPYLSDSAALDVLCRAAEFENVKVRPEELVEMDKLATSAPLDVKAPLEEPAGKVSVLLQCYVSQLRPTGFTLVSDTNYCAQNGARVARALFEVALRKGLCSLATCFLRLAKAIDRRCWWWETPLRQLANDLKLPDSVMAKLEAAAPSLDQLLDMDAAEVGQLVRHDRLGPKILGAARSLPKLKCDVAVQPVTRAILRLTVTLAPDFAWDPKVSGSSEPFWVWVGDSGRSHVYHSEYVLIHKPKARRHAEPVVLALTIPCAEPLPSQYLVHVLSDRWVGLDEVRTVSFRHLVLPEQHPPHTDLLMLTPLPVGALQHPAFEQLYAGKLTHFNPIQTQVFHTLYRTDRNVLLGAPTSSGKTLVAELALLRVLNQRAAAAAPGADKASSGCVGKIVYVAPLKALARERVKDWRLRLGGQLGLVVLELTGDVTPDPQSLRRADVIITTPEKWDGVSRGWRSRDYVRAVQLVILDEIHLLGEERGAVLEVLVSRMRHMAASLGTTVRLLGLSTALANAHDLGDWLGVDPRPGRGLYNFRPSVRPVPMEVHIRGFPGQHYCPRMATMNKPTYSAILEHSPRNPVLVFVASRRQTRLTALDLISFCAAADHPKQWLHMRDDEVDAVAATCSDDALKHTLGYGVGLHHAGLTDHDRSIVEELFVHGKIQVLVCTSTLAWGVNFPARLVVVKGTEFFDGKLGRYVDFPVTDVLQMMGRAGRPQFDDKGVACVFAHQPKKQFYKKFLYEPFPVESSLKAALHNHLNAEVCGGTIKNKQDAVEYLTWTYFFRRLLVNPAYYGCADASTDTVQAFLLALVDDTLADLAGQGCLELGPGVPPGDAAGGVSVPDFEVRPTTAGRVGAYYYLDYRSVGVVLNGLRGPDAGPASAAAVCRLLSQCYEFAELPVRHNEDGLNGELAASLPWRLHPQNQPLDSPHTKAFLLLQAHCGRAPLPVSDFVNDTKSVLDQALRVLNAAVDLAADEGLLGPALHAMRFAQLLVQATLPDQTELAQLPGLSLHQATQAEASLRSKGGQGGQGGGGGSARGGLAGLAALYRHKERGGAAALLAAAGASSKAVEALEALPVASVAVAGLKEDRATDGGGSGGGGGAASVAVSVAADADCTVFVDLSFGAVFAAGAPARHGQPSQPPGHGRPGARFRVRAPFYPKAKELGWWLVLGSGDELLALKRINRTHNQRVSLSFAAPEAGGAHSLDVWLVADSIRGLDVHLPVPLLVVE